MSPRTAGLGAVLFAAKAVLLASYDDPLTLPLLAAWFWQDVVVIVAFATVEHFARRTWMVRPVYVALVLLAAANTPVARELGSPLTAAMLRATRGTLADSILHHATATNIAVCAALLLLGALVPVLWRRSGLASSPVSGRRVAGWAAGALLFAALGRYASSFTDARGMERNPVFALLRTSLPRVRGESADQNWRAPLAPVMVGQQDDSATVAALSELRGSAAGSNVLLVILESTGAQYLKPYGAESDPAPNLTALAEKGVLFENAYAVYPESVRGLVTFLSSRYPGFDIANAHHARIMAPSLASILANAGYNTALFHSGRFIYLGMEELLAGSGFAILEDAGHIGGNHNSSFGVDEPAAVQRILGWLDSLSGSSPFFVTYLPIAGHHPYVFEAPAPFPAGNDVGRYRNAIFDSDRAIGVLLRGLRSRGLDTNTLIVIASDHGEAFGQHPGNYGHTLAIYEENVKVPLVLIPPHARSVPLRVRTPASLLDVAPTVLDMLGLQSPGEFAGSSLLRSEVNMSLFFTDYSLGLLGVRDGCIKYIYEMESRRSRMFNLCDDPAEERDIHTQNARLAGLYSERLQRWIAAQVFLLGSR